MATIQQILAQRNEADFCEPGRAEARSLIARIHKLGGTRQGVEIEDRPEAAQLIRQIYWEDAGLTPIGALLGGVLGEVRRRCELRQYLEDHRGPISDGEFLNLAERTGILI